MKKLILILALLSSSVFANSEAIEQSRIVGCVAFMIAGDVPITSERQLALFEDYQTIEGYTRGYIHAMSDRDLQAIAHNKGLTVKQAAILKWNGKEYNCLDY